MLLVDQDKKRQFENCMGFIVRPFPGHDGKGSRSSSWKKEQAEESIQPVVRTRTRVVKPPPRPNA